MAEPPAVPTTVTMPTPEQRSTSPSADGTLGLGYVHLHLARALVAAADDHDAEARERARQRVIDWARVFTGMLSGSLQVGSRTPVKDVPNWATLKVTTGGFATGELLAGGPLQAYERTLLERYPDAPEAEARALLNAHHLTDAGLAELRELLHSGRYDVRVPEEGALLVVAWLVENGRTQQARELLETLAPWFSRLRFYPVRTERPRSTDAEVFLQDVESTAARIRRIPPNGQILAQKEAIHVWAPLYDRAVQLFLETVVGDLPSLRCGEDGQPVYRDDGASPVVGGWPCQVYPPDWDRRATELLREYAEVRAQHPPRAGRRPTEFDRLRLNLQRCVRDPSSLRGRDVGFVRRILACYLTKRGTPGSARWRDLREAERRSVAAPMHHEIAQVLLARLAGYPADEGLDEVDPVLVPVTAEEAEHGPAPAGTEIPPTLRARVTRARRDTVEALVDAGLITSGDALAAVLPQITGQVRGAGLEDPVLVRLFTALYAAFRRRRSLLLLNLEHQVQLEELPWVAALDGAGGGTARVRELARETLREVAVLALTSFPYAILPNKLLQELRALARTAELDLPLVDELAADIFMGQFTEKFLESARRAAALLEGTLYSQYYEIDYRRIRRMRQRERVRTGWFKHEERTPFADLCAARAGVTLGSWKPAANGMVIEQQQILTTQNLAVLFTELGLRDALVGRLNELARACFRWICRRHRVTRPRRAQLVQVKGSAYAWRQMIFFLALLPDAEVAEFLAWADGHLGDEPEPFRTRFQPALRGLALAREGVSLDSPAADAAGARRFLGWATDGHWLLQAE
jgi:hypothetical protein